MDEAALALYRELRGAGAAADSASLAAGLDLEPQEAQEAWSRLDSLELVSRGQDDPSKVVLVTPEAALTRVLRRQRRNLEDARREAEHTYRAIESLVEVYLPTSATDQSAVDVELVTDTKRLAQIIGDLPDMVRDVVSSMHPGPLPPAEAMEYSLRSDRDLIEQGLRVRAIYLQRVAAVPAIAEFFQQMARAGVELRLATVIPVHMVVGDHALALLPLDPDNPALGVVVVRGVALIRTFSALYEQAWHHAAPYVLDPQEAGDSDLSAVQATVLRMLASGMKDETIARSLGFSLRTASRHISEVMQKLNAGSRFEAGVRAVQLGWLDHETGE